MGSLGEKTKVPLGWLVSAIVFTCTGAWSTAYFVFGVKMDIRDLRSDVKLLKKKAGIPETDDSVVDSYFIKPAEAAKK